ncbi:hypothetical protein [Thermococcus sp.]
MKRTYLIVALLVFVVLTAGCTGNTGTTSTQGRTASENPTQGSVETTSSQSGGAGSSTGNSGGSVSGIADLLKGVVAKGFSVSENGYSYRAIKITVPAGKFLYYPYYHYNDEAFLLWSKYVLIYSPYDGKYLSGESAKPELELDGVMVLPAEVKLFYPNPEDDYHLMIGTDGKLRIVEYSDTVDVNGLDTSADAYETLAEYDFDANGLLITGEYDENDEFHYEFVAWKGNELRIYPYTEDQLDSKEKVQPVVYRLPSEIKDVPLYESDVLYVSTEGGFYIVPKPFSGYSKKAYKVSSSGLFAPVIEWNGDFAVYGNGKLEWIRTGLGEDGIYLTKKAEARASGIVSLYGPYMTGNGVLLASFNDGKVGIYGIYSSTYGSDEDKIEAIGWLNLKVPLKGLAGDYNPDADRIELIGLGSDGSLYVLSGTPARGAPPAGGTGGATGTQTETSTSTQTQTSTTETSTQSPTETQTSTPGKSELKAFYENGLVASGISFTKDGYSYTGIKVQAKIGKLYYFPYGDDSYLYAVWSNYLRRPYPWNAYSDYRDGEKPMVSGGLLEELPGVPKVIYEIPNGDQAIMVDEKGKLHILLGLKDKTIDGMDVSTFKSDVAYDFDADGVSIGSGGIGGGKIFIAWKGSELRLYAYSGDDVYVMLDEGKEIRVEPIVYNLPSKILEVNPHLDNDFIVIRAEDGVYIVANPRGHYKEDRNVYRVFGSAQFVGAHGYWGIDDLLVYANGKLYVLDCEYNEDSKTVDVTVKDSVSIPNVVGLYGEYDGNENNILLSLSDGTLVAYSYGWDDAKGDYAFKHLMDFHLGVPLAKFHTDYRPDDKWIQIMGIGTDGAFYIFEVQG